ncbi:hypothetical protein H696_05362 [Fonticula alba]|uniref:Uncharacterized protein n=1 Tax=Fonticula alba TaxID=691883 RepID=A0A058Z1G0_FONAL|nr:hypothetical protein H696_05362 [Fonticula alba]KCV68109.1 hypothetical protein H696_05362 [Fonticula alba]|eukprot:XP_009497483.1 hypothetical protein H696_05362 [Fonticula alba]
MDQPPLVLSWVPADRTNIRITAAPAPLRTGPADSHWPASRGRGRGRGHSHLPDTRLSGGPGRRPSPASLPPPPALPAPQAAPSPGLGPAATLGPVPAASGFELTPSLGCAGCAVAGRLAPPGSTCTECGLAFPAGFLTAPFVKPPVRVDIRPALAGTPGPDGPHLLALALELQVTPRLGLRTLGGCRSVEVRAWFGPGPRPTAAARGGGGGGRRRRPTPAIAQAPAEPDPDAACCLSGSTAGTVIGRFDLDRDAHFVGHPAPWLLLWLPTALPGPAVAAAVRAWWPTAGPLDAPMVPFLGATASVARCSAGRHQTHRHPARHLPIRRLAVDIFRGAPQIGLGRALVLQIARPPPNPEAEDTPPAGGCLADAAGHPTPQQLPPSPEQLHDALTGRDLVDPMLLPSGHHPTGRTYPVMDRDQARVKLSRMEPGGTAFRGSSWLTVSAVMIDASTADGRASAPGAAASPSASAGMTTASPYSSVLIEGARGKGAKHK